ncbi:MAG: sigma-70 family RNA polymerase sigma factor [Planctomycetota bacterium]|nr:sigma-70 family RNA polymerase sigma factor [Planctomycetota bacterium]
MAAKLSHDSCSSAVPAPAVPLETLFAEHHHEVYGYLRVVCRNHQIAEDLTQEVFLLAWRRGLTPGPGLSHWFRSVARNLALNEMTRKKPVLWDAETLRRAEPAAPEAPAPAGRFEEDLATLRTALRNLPEADRRLLNARYEKEEPLAVISEQTGQSVGYLKQRLLRLRRKLARAFGLRSEERPAAHDRRATVLPQ